MGKLNIGNVGQKAVGREDLLNDIAASLDLGTADPEISQPTEGSSDPFTTALEPTPTTGQITMEPTAPTAEEALELEEQQKELEAVHSLQQRFGTRVVDILPDIYNIVGPDAAPRLLGAIKRLRDSDSVIIPFDEAKRMTTLKSMMGVSREPEQNVVAEGDTRRMNYVDPEMTKPLNSAELFGHLDAVRFSGDSRILEVLPDLQILTLTLMEGILAEQMGVEADIPADLIELLGPEDVADLTGMDPTDLNSQVSEGKLGRMVADEWAKMRQVAQEGIGTQIDAHMDPANKLTKEAYEQLGLWAKQMYSLANPSLYSPVQVKAKDGKNKRTEYLLTPTGHRELETVKKDLMPPKIVARPQLPVDSKPTTQNVRTKEATGNNFESQKDKKRKTKEDELRENVAKVKHVVSPTRLKAGMLLSLVGVSAASSAKLVTKEGQMVTLKDGSQVPDADLVVQGNAAEMLSLGQKRADKINNASRNALLRAESLSLELEALTQVRYDPHSRTYNTHHSRKAKQLLEKIQILRSFAIEASDPQWKLRMYRREATKALEMLQDIAEFKDDPISFTNYIQRGTSRLGYSQHKMNMQTHKLARQLYCSGTHYQIKPGSNSNAEWAMLVTWGAHLFAESNVVPEQMVRNMRHRIQKRDDKLMSIANVGGKLQAILEGYNVDATTDALLKMTQVENQVKGVGGVMSTLKDFQGDPEVKLFLDEAFQHPNETINLIEEAVELHRYMEARANGRSFASSMRPVEVDGISNGLASMTAQLGLMDAMYRVGMLREDPTKVLADYQGVEGNLRKLLASNMRNSLPDLLGSTMLSNDLGVELSDLDFVTDILELAIANESEFLKPPLMTLPYGQAVKSMLNTVMTAVTTSPALTEMAESSPHGVIGVSKILHRILEHNLDITLGPEVLQFSEAIKEMTSVAMLVDEPILFRKPTGTMTSINSADYIAQEGMSIISKIEERYRDPQGDREFGDPGKNKPSTLGNTKTTRSEYRPTKLTMNSLGTNSKGGSSVRQGILPQIIISIDGAAMAVALTGANYRHIQKESGTQVPYVVTIYDAVVGDLGSFKSLTETLNKSWLNVSTKYDLIREVADGTNMALKSGMDKIRLQAKENPDGLVGNKAQADHLFEILVRMSQTNKKLFPAIREIMRRFRGLATDDSLTKKQKFFLRNPSDVMTNKEALAITALALPSAKNSLTAVYKIADDAKVRREHLRKVLGPNPVFQYHMDALKSFNFHSIGTVDVKRYNPKQPEP